MLPLPPHEDAKEFLTWCEIVPLKFSWCIRMNLSMVQNSWWAFSVPNEEIHIELYTGKKKKKKANISRVPQEN